MRLQRLLYLLLRGLTSGVECGVNVVYLAVASGTRVLAEAGL